nr:MAG TPA: hypothetical protein [Caudoviricetes sp.]
MGEVIDMKDKKKYIIAAVITVIVSLLITVPPILQEKVQDRNYAETEKQIANQILNSLQQNGFSNAYTINSDTTGESYIYFNDYDDICISVSVQNDFKLIELSNLKHNTDVNSILDATIPAFDKNFKSGNGKIIMKRLTESRYYNTNDDILGGITSYHNIDYNEFLDDTCSYTESIYIWLR